jgi:hypothetical protein
MNINVLTVINTLRSIKLTFDQVSIFVVSRDFQMLNFAYAGMEMAYQKYTTGVSSICPYDYCSITHNKMDDYTSLPGSPVFNVTNAPYFIPRVDQLSECDCKQISATYGCPIDKCVPSM